MKIKLIICTTICISLFICACANGKINEKAEPDVQQPTPIKFKNASVHDPSIIKVGDIYYVFGSHMASAKSDDLINWPQVTMDSRNGNKLVPNAKEEMAEALEWAKTDTFWAPDVIQLSDGKYYMYYCNCVGDRPLACIGIAVSDDIEGPYKNLGLILKSGMTSGPSEDGTSYDATKHPNCIDPHVFYDKEGLLWMVYGSYSGGIYIMKLDPETGFPYPDQGYGKKLLGANHSRIEGPYILYSPESDYYYLFLSFGGLDAKGGYNIRVCRSKNPDGPYYDAEDNDMMNCAGKQGSFFDDAAIAPYGVKLMGNFRFEGSSDELGKKAIGYVSPGHNSAYYDQETGKYYLIFHTRFLSRGEHHEVRVHQMFLNEEDWLVVAPHRYTGESAGKYDIKEIIGQYKYINHGKDITAEVKKSVDIKLNKNKTITGGIKGKWEVTGDNTIQLTIDKAIYQGILLRQWDSSVDDYVMTFSALSDNGVAIWGSKD